MVSELSVENPKFLDTKINSIVKKLKWPPSDMRTSGRFVVPNT